ncbi:hypothetical protein FKM82_027742 [Ascaphus truei]
MQLRNICTKRDFCTPCQATPWAATLLTPLIPPLITIISLGVCSKLELGESHLCSAWSQSGHCTQILGNVARLTVENRISNYILYLCIKELICNKNSVHLGPRLSGFLNKVELFSYNFIFSEM